MIRRNKPTSLIPSERILNGILFIRGKKVMFDKDLAELYGVKTGNLNKAVKRNIERFPSDFMFQLTNKELDDISRFQIGTLDMRFQIGTASKRNIRYLPYVFTEQGVAMLSSVLNSKRAMQVNIQIIRTFTQLRELLTTNTKLRKKVEEMERKYDSRLKQVFDILKQLLMKEVSPKAKIGFRIK